MSFDEKRPGELLSIREAAALVGRTPGSVKSAVRFGVLHGDRCIDSGRAVWRIKPAELLAWNEAHPPVPRPRLNDTWNRTVELLAEYGPLHAEELGILLERHPGNARKHLAILEKQGRARRLDDGQWVLVDDQVGAA
jgi:predicted transcriptional regulator